MNFQKKVSIVIVIFSIFFVSFSGKETPKSSVKYKYLLYLPDNYNDSKNKVPLLIYLHGSSVRGSELNKIKAYGLPYLIEKGEKYDFIIVSPQCPASKSWNSENWFLPLYSELIEKYRIDTNRVYLTGMSLGGYGAWNLAMEYPDKFAAVVPLCGGGNVKKVCNINHVPVWAFHGTEDTLVSIKETEKLVNELKKCNGNVKFSRLEGKGHSIHRVYEDRKIYNWMLKQKRDSVTNILRGQK